MKVSISILAAMIGGASAFVPTTSTAVPQSPSTVPKMSSEPIIDAEILEESKLQPINGWTPDPSKPCYGLPGAIEPLGYFDPLGFCKGRDLVGVKRFREAEVMHARVAMLATVGFWIAEKTPTIAYGGYAPTIAIHQIPEVPMWVLLPFFVAINFAEALRAKIGWVKPSPDTLFKLRDNYYPGDIGFDPLNFKPKDPAAAERMEARELSNGRLAMLAAAGMIAQELATGNPL